MNDARIIFSLMSLVFATVAEANDADADTNGVGANVTLFVSGASHQNIGPSQDGVDSVLTFTDTASGTQNFYRILVSP